MRPRYSKWIINSEIRQQNRERVLKYDASQFDNFEDWFFFSHIDPVQRFWHAFGFVVGCIFYITLLFHPSWLLFLSATFFFYGAGLISHIYYDGGAGKSEPGAYNKSTPMVLKINAWTLSGTYQKRLREFVQKYPQTQEAYDLEEDP